MLASPGEGSSRGAGGGCGQRDPRNIDVDVDGDGRRHVRVQSPTSHLDGVPSNGLHHFDHTERGVVDHRHHTTPEQGVEATLTIDAVGAHGVRPRRRGDRQIEAMVGAEPDRRLNVRAWDGVGHRDPHTIAVAVDGDGRRRLTIPNPPRHPSALPTHDPPHPHPPAARDPSHPPHQPAPAQQKPGVASGTRSSDDAGLLRAERLRHR